MPVSKLDAVVRQVATDKLITRAEAKKIISAVKESPGTKPIDDVFKAIDKSGAAIEAGATRLLLSELDQKMTRAEWVSYAQKATSPAGLWGPSDEGGTKVSRAELPPALKKIFDKWSASEDAPNVTKLDVAGKDVYLFDQYSEFGTSFGAFDEAGKSIELKEDTTNVRRNARRTQAKYDAVFKQPEMAAWAKSIEHTDLGVIINYRENATALTGAGKTAASTPDVKKAERDMRATLKAGAQLELFKNSKDGSYLLVGTPASNSGAAEYAHFSKAGKLLATYSLEP
jgi:hypothetical protein